MPGPLVSEISQVQTLPALLSMAHFPVRRLPLLTVTAKRTKLLIHIYVKECIKRQHRKTIGNTKSRDAQKYEHFTYLGRRNPPLDYTQFPSTCLSSGEVKRWLRQLVKLSSFFLSHFLKKK